MSDDLDWLTEEFELAEQEYQALPISARPVVVAAAERSGKGVVTVW